MDKTQNNHNLTKLQEKAILVGVILPNTPRKYSEPLEELASLAQTADVDVVGTITQLRDEFHPAMYVGYGKVEEIKMEAEQCGANLLISDDDLDMSQARNLERETDLRVIDRTELILHIFAAHARTKEAKLQVELAQLLYALPRLKRMWEHLDRYEGGIGMKGPGEKQLETDKRLIKKRIQHLTEAIHAIQRRKEREVHTRAVKFPTIGLVGYTNAGKSTLMNTLTNANVLVEDKLFSTLETCTRMWEPVKGRKIMLSDTVGFIDKLPHHLVASFKATLEEASQADALLHVVDASHPDAARQIEVVRNVLHSIDLHEKPEILVLNKTDAVQDMADLNHLAQLHPHNIMISAMKRENIDKLCEAVIRVIEADMVDVEVTLPIANGKLMAWMEEYSRILAKSFETEKAHYKIRLSKPNAQWLGEQADVQET